MKGNGYAERYGSRSGELLREYGEHRQIGVQLHALVAPRVKRLREAAVGGALRRHERMFS